MSSVPIYASPIPIPVPVPAPVPLPSQHPHPHHQLTPSSTDAHAPGPAPASAHKREPQAAAAGASTFAFARVKGELCLVQVSSSITPSALTPLDITLFRHEFISIFRLAGARTLHPADIAIVEPIDARMARYEEESGTVFLARELMERMRRLSGGGPKGQGHGRYGGQVRWMRQR